MMDETDIVERKRAACLCTERIFRYFLGAGCGYVLYSGKQTPGRADQP